MRHELTLTKQGHTFVFRFPSGREVEVVEAFGAQAEDPNSTLDWFDAAILTHQVATQLISEAMP